MINDILENIVKVYNTQNESFNESTKVFEVNNHNQYAIICCKTFKIIEDNLDFETKQLLSDMLNRKVFEIKQDKIISEYRFLYTYLENTNRLDWKIEKRERPDFRIYNQDSEEYIEITQDITEYESIAVKCLNRYYYGDNHIDKGLKKYLNIRKINREIIVSPKEKLNLKKRRENIFCIICKKIDKYASYINEEPKIIDGTKTILARMRTPIDIKEPNIIGVIQRINRMINKSIVERVALITYDNKVIIINKI